MSLSATHSCGWRPNKSKPPSGEVLLWWTNVKPYYRTAEVLLTMSKVLIFRKLTQFALVAVPLISHCWLDTAGSDRERPAALCASHVGTQPALGLSLLNPTPTPYCWTQVIHSQGATTHGHTPLYCLVYPLSGINEAAIVICFHVILLDTFHVMLFWNVNL